MFTRQKFVKNKIVVIFAPLIARSSNGRTSDFGSDCVGSNPARATVKESAPTERIFYLVLSGVNSRQYR